MLSGWAQRNHQTPRERAAGTAKVTKVRQDGRRRTAGFAEGGAARRGVRAAPRAGRGRGRIPREPLEGMQSYLPGTGFPNSRIVK